MGGKIAPQDAPVDNDPARRGMFSKRSFLFLTLALAACSPPPPPASSVGGPFTLVDQTGRTVDQSILNGKWSAIFFGFTYCPDICPATLQVLAEAKAKLGTKADKLQVVLVSVDPERDTPSLLKTYLDNPAFPPGTIGLTGSPEQVAAAAKAYKVFYEKAGTGEDYLINHVSIVYLMDPKGRFSRPIAHGTSPDETARIISEAMKAGG